MVTYGLELLTAALSRSHRRNASKATGDNKELRDHKHHQSHYSI